MSTKSRNSFFCGALCISYVALSGVALAEEVKAKPVTTARPVAKKSPAPQTTETDSWYGQSVFERARPEYTNDPKRLGSFKFKPEITINEVADSNIYAANTAEKSDFITQVSPGVALESDWSRHALGFNASGDLGFYSDHSRENFGDYSLGASARLDAFRETFFLGSASTSHLHEDRGSPDSVANAKNPTEYNKNDASLSFVRNLHRVALKLDGDYTGYDYQNGKTTAGTVITNSGRDRDEYKITGRVGYEIIPEYEAFIRSALNERNYDAALDATGVNRDSNGYEVVTGTAINLGGKTKGEVFVGYMDQSYDSNSLEDVSGAQFGGNVLWNATGLTSVKTGILRGVQETTISSTSSGYIATQYSVALEHEFLYNVLGGVNVSYETDEYEGVGVTREDDITGAGAELRYLLNRNASVIGKYNYTNRDSSAANQDYDRNVLSLGLKIVM